MSLAKSVIANLIVWPIIIGMIVLGLVTISGFRQPIESGEYTGQKIDYTHQRGLILQTNDLTTKTNDRSSAREDWCIPDNRQELVEKVRELESGEKIVINYHAPLWIWPGTCDSDIQKVIKSIETIDERSDKQ